MYYFDDSSLPHDDDHWWEPKVLDEIKSDTIFFLMLNYIDKHVACIIWSF